jgi:putative ABC transport system permease protein
MNKNRWFMLKMLMSYLLRRRSRIAVALIGVALGATVLLGMITLCYDVPRQMSQEFRSYGANMALFPAGDRSAISLEDVASAAALLPPDKVMGVTPFRYEPVRSNLQPYTAVGTDFSQVRRTSPFWKIDGAWPQAENEVLVGADIAEFIRLGAGDRITLSGRNQQQARFSREMTISGVVSSGGVEDGFIFMDMNDMTAMLGGGGAAHVAEISLNADLEELNRLAGAIQQTLPSLEARLVKRVTQSETKVLGKLTTLVYLVTLVVLVLTMICVATTMMTIVMERRQEIGLKKAIGADNRSVAAEFLREGLIMGIVGGVAGSVCGLIFAQFISSSVFGRSIAVEFYLLPATIGISMIVTILACLIPARRAMAVEPALVLRGE